jgi:hypothetical protein
VNLSEIIKILDPLGIQIVYDKNLKLFLVILDEQMEYLHPSDLNRFDEDEFKTFLAKALIRYAAQRDKAPRVH